MTITKDRKRYKSIDLLPTIDDFIILLKEVYNNINFENENIKSSIYSIYDRIINDDGNILYLRFSRWLPKQFGFKYSNKFSLPFWLERGFTDEDYNNYSKNIFKEIGDRLTKYVKNIKDKSYEYDTSYSNIYVFNTIKFEQYNKPNCNLCKSELILKKSMEFDTKIYTIEGCSNKKCITQDNNSKNIKWEAFLPESEYLKIKNKLSSIPRPFSKKFWLNKGLSEEDAIKKVFDIQSNNSKKFKGKKTGKSKYKLREKGYTEAQIRETCLAPSNYEFWIKKGYTKQDAELIISKNNTYAAKQVDFEKRLLPSNIEYWINKGFSEKESILNVKKHQTTFSKEICIEKHGIEKGIEIFNQRTKKWQETLYKNGNIKGGYSKISQELFNNILKIKDGNYKYATNNSELVLQENNKNYYYDFLDINNNKIIEYNGDQYHANPKTYNSDDYPHPYRKYKGYTSNDIWEYDRNKIKIAENNGYEVLIIWDSEYKKNKELTIQKCINFLTDK